jgi:hypothetical protein
MTDNTQSERRTLSSSQTVIAKFVGPLLGVAMAGLVLWSVLAHTIGRFGPLSPDAVQVPAGSPALKFLVVAMAAAIVYGLYWSYRLKRVAVDGDSIYISDYSQEVRLPLGAIVGVSENRWLKFHPVTIELDRDTPWGRTIKFMPKIRYFVPRFISHPVVAELRDMAYYARAGERAGRGIGEPYEAPPLDRYSLGPLSRAEDET